MRVGLFLSRCEGLLDKTLDLSTLAQDFSPVATALVVSSFQQSEDIKSICNTVKDQGLEAVVLAGNSPQEYLKTRQGELLSDLLQQAGINPNKIAYVNLKEQVAEVHQKGQAAQEKAALLIKVGLAKVNLAHDMKISRLAPQKAVAIIGRNQEAYLVAEQLLRRNIRVYIIDQKRQEEDFPTALNSVKAFVELNPKAEIIGGFRVVDLFGWAGDFTLKLSKENQEVTIDIGAILVTENSNQELVEEIRPILHLEKGSDDLLASVSRDTKAVNSVEEGIYLIPSGLGDDLPSRVSMADSAAINIINLLEEPELLHKNVISEVDRDRCGGCGACVKTCSFQASNIDPVLKISVIDEKRCKGCGNCVTSCPTGARDLLTYPQKYLLKAIQILSEFGGKNEPKVLAILCEGCGYRAVDAAAGNTEYLANILPLGVRCGGNIDTQLILEAFLLGFDGITICKCSEGHCLNIVGNTDLDRRANLFREVLRSRGINDDRLRIVDACKSDDNQCVSTLINLLNDIKSGGGN